VLNVLKTHIVQAQHQFVKHQQELVLNVTQMEIVLLVYLSALLQINVFSVWEIQIASQVQELHIAIQQEDA